jgi:hypothetical protein
MRRYTAGAYWAAVVMVGVFGTMVADVLHVGFGVHYAVSTVIFSLILATALLGWRRIEGTLSVHSIDTPRRDGFYVGHGSGHLAPWAPPPGICWPAAWGWGISALASCSWSGRGRRWTALREDQARRGLSDALAP